MFGKSYINKLIIKNTSSLLLSKLISSIIGILLISLLTRKLGIVSYGEFTFIFTYLSFFSLFSDLGFNQIIVYEFSKSTYRSIRAKVSLINSKAILIFLAFLFPIVLLPFLRYSYHLKQAIIFGSIALASGNLMSFFFAMLQAKLKLMQVAYLDFQARLITFLSIILFSFYSLNISLSICGIIIGNLVTTVVAYYLIRKEIFFDLFIDFKLIKKMLTLYFPIGISSLLTIVYFKIDTLLLHSMKSSVDVGIYGLSYKILENILTLWGLYMASIFPLLSKYFASSNSSKYRNILKYTIKSSMAFSLISILFSLVFAPFIVHTLGGAEFNLSIQPFRILSCSIPFFLINNVFYYIIISFGKTKYLVWPLVICLLINIGLNLILIPQYSYYGSSFATVITEVLRVIIYFVVLNSSFMQESKYWRLIHE